MMLAAILIWGGCGKQADHKGDEDNKMPFYQKNPIYDFDLKTARNYNAGSGRYEWNGELDRMLHPFWMGNVIYNETVMLVRHGEEISGKLLYKPTKILSVRDYGWQNEFKENVDYTVSGNRIIRGENSSIPYLDEENLKGDNLPDGYNLVPSISDVLTDVVKMGATIYTEGTLIYGHQISVSYVYDAKNEDTGYFAAFNEGEFRLTREKIAGGGDVRIAVLGDSIAEGCSSSSKFNREPYLPNFVDMTVGYLNNLRSANHTGGTVEAGNFSKGGMTSEWGAADGQVERVTNYKPDLFIIHFGVNDNGSDMSAGTFADNIESIVLRVREACPDCEFMIIKCFTPEQMTYNDELFEKYWKGIDSLKSIGNVYPLDIYAESLKMLETKKYMDVTGNGINHLNDYTSRFYTMNILSKLIDFNQLIPQEGI